MKIHTLAAIDIGSNAVRLLISNVIVQKGKRPVFRSIDLIRVPIRLGEEAFLKKKISKLKSDTLLKAMQAFKNLMEIFKVDQYRACATSAMREAKNSPRIIKEIKNKCKINIDIISGKEEAAIIYTTHTAEHIHRYATYLYIDVGGGSTEISVFSGKRIIDSRSFNIGTIRLLKNKIEENEWKEIKKWIKLKTRTYKSSMAAIGSGGNINKLFKMANKKKWEPLTLKKLENMYNDLRSYNVEERITILGLNPDRADVIVPAAKIFIDIMEWAEIKNIYVPRIGLVDGIIHEVYEKNILKK